MTVRLHRGDLPDLSRYTGAVAIDTETMGLNPHRDRLCVVQLSPGDGSADVVQIPKGHTDAPNLKALLADPANTKIFHFARFDIAVLYQTLSASCRADLLHQDRLAADPHLYRPPWPQGPGARGAQCRSLQAAAIERLGFRQPDRGAARLRRLRRAASARLARAARCHAGAGRPHRAGASRLRLPADPGSSISRAGPTRTFSRIPERFGAAARLGGRPVSAHFRNGLSRAAYSGVAGYNGAPASRTRRATPQEPR